MENYRQQMALKKDLNSGDKSGLEFHRKTLLWSQYDVLQQVIFIREEKKMLKFRDELKNDSKKQEAYDNRNNNIP